MQCHQCLVVTAVLSLQFDFGLEQPARDKGGKVLDKNLKKILQMQSYNNAKIKSFYVDL